MKEPYLSATVEVPSLNGVEDNGKTKDTTQDAKITCQKLYYTRFWAQ